MFCHLFRLFPEPHQFTETGHICDECSRRGTAARCGGGLEAWLLGENLTLDYVVCSWGFAKMVVPPNHPF